jgi:hypothetical protein
MPTASHNARIHVNMLEHLQMTLNQATSVYGVKGGPSLMSLVPSFDLVRGFSPNYMHSFLLGVVRQLVSLWFE